MLLILIILFFVMIIEVFLIGFLFSNISLDIKKLNINSTNRKMTDIYIEKMNITLKIYLFKHIPILNIKLYKKYFEIFKIKIKYEKILKPYNLSNKIDVYRKIYQFYKVIKENSDSISIRKINPKFNSLNFNLNISTENSILTSFCTCFVSVFFSFLLKKNLSNKKYNSNKFKYKVIPIYLNSNSFKIDLETNISFSMINILEFIYKYNQVTKEHKKKRLIENILKRSIEGFKILDKTRYVNKKVKAFNNRF